MLREERRGRSLFWAWVGLLLIPIALGVFYGLQVLIEGLSITNLSDGTPWGLWIVFDLSFVALSAGAFSLSAICYLLGRESFKPLARMAVFIGLLGYSGALLCLFMDIGRPDRFWHGWVFWNVHSMLWEVTMCITLYFSVLLLEVFPLVIAHPLFDRFPRLQRFGHRIHRFRPLAGDPRPGIFALASIQPGRNIWRGHWPFSPLPCHDSAVIYRLSSGRGDCLHGSSHLDCAVAETQNPRSHQCPV